MLLSFKISDESQLLKMPYGANEGSISPNIGFINLKTQPERIDEIHELEGFPELKELLLLLNKPDTVFATLRINTGKNIHKFEGYSNSYFSFLTVTLVEP